MARSALPVLGPNERVIGIDLGTTTSVMATVEAGVPGIIPNAEGSRTTPSVVAFTKEGDLLVGEVAKRQAVINPMNTFMNVKRFIGRRWTEVEVEAVPFAVQKMGGDLPQFDCPATDTRLAPEEVSAHVLRKLRKDAEAYLGADVTKAVVTVPHYFTDSQRQSTKDAAYIAGLDVLRICNEPTMAALAYGATLQHQARLLVLDLGGGTFDVSLLEIADGIVEVVSTAGDGNLGGTDFDQRIVNWLADRFKEAEGVDLREDKQALQRLVEASETAKIELSSVEEVEISIPFITAGEDGPKHIEETLTREEFEDMCADLIKRLDGPVKEATKLMLPTMRWVNEIVLVGGASRMPAVQRRARKITDFRPMNRTLNPEEVVALGAATQASMIVGEVRDIMLFDVLPLSLGVETEGGVFSKVVEKNTKIPVEVHKFFSTAEDRQDCIEVKVCQGERPFAADNKALGSFMLTEIPPAPAGVPQIEVTFIIDREGILTASAKDWATMQSQSIVVKDASTLEEWEVERMKKEAEIHWMEDKVAKEKAALRHQAQHLVSTTQRKVDVIGPKVPPELRDVVMAKVDDLAQELREEDDIDYYELGERIEALKAELMKVGLRVWGSQVAPQTQPGPGKPRPLGTTVGGGPPLLPDFVDAE